MIPGFPNGVRLSNGLFLLARRRLEATRRLCTIACTYSQLLPHGCRECSGFWLENRSRRFGWGDLAASRERGSRGSTSM
jgi:hypothetical protein